MLISHLQHSKILEKESYTLDSIVFPRRLQMLILQEGTLRLHAICPTCVPKSGLEFWENLKKFVIMFCVHIYDPSLPPKIILLTVTVRMIRRLSYRLCGLMSSHRRRARHKIQIILDLVTRVAVNGP